MRGERAGGVCGVVTGRVLVRLWSVGVVLVGWEAGRTTRSHEGASRCRCLHRVVRPGVVPLEGGLMTFWGDVDGRDIDPDGLWSVLDEVSGYLFGADGKGGGGLSRQRRHFVEGVADAQYAAGIDPITKALGEYVEAALPELSGMINKGNKCLSAASDATWAYIGRAARKRRSCASAVSRISLRLWRTLWSSEFPP